MSDAAPFDRVIRGDIVLSDRVLRDGYVAIRGEQSGGRKTLQRDHVFVQKASYSSRAQFDHEVYVIQGFKLLGGQLH